MYHKNSVKVDVAPASGKVSGAPELDRTRSLWLLNGNIKDKHSARFDVFSYQRGIETDFNARADIKLLQCHHWSVKCRSEALDHSVC